MKRLATLCLVLLFARPLLAVDDGDVSYVGGTVENLKEESPGKFDMTSQTELVFVSSSVKLVIPYASIDSYDHSQQVAHHLGVLPAIAVSLVKKRQRKHFLRIAYHDEIKTPQVAIFEVPKKMPLTLLRGEVFGSCVHSHALINASVTSLIMVARSELAMPKVICGCWSINTMAESAGV